MCISFFFLYSVKMIKLNIFVIVQCFLSFELAPYGADWSIILYIFFRFAFFVEASSLGPLLNWTLLLSASIYLEILASENFPLLMCQMLLMLPDVSTPEWLLNIDFIQAHLCVVFASLRAASSAAQIHLALREWDSPQQQVGHYALVASVPRSPRQVVLRRWMDAAWMNIAECFTRLNGMTMVLMQILLLI